MNGLKDVRRELDVCTNLAFCLLIVVVFALDVSTGIWIWR